MFISNRLIYCHLQKTAGTYYDYKSREIVHSKDKLIFDCYYE